MSFQRSKPPPVSLWSDSDSDEDVRPKPRAAAPKVHVPASSTNTNKPKNKQSLMTLGESDSSDDEGQHSYSNKTQKKHTPIQKTSSDFQKSSVPLNQKENENEKTRGGATSTMSMQPPVPGYFAKDNDKVKGKTVSSSSLSSPHLSSVVKPVVPKKEIKYLTFIEREREENRKKLQQDPFSQVCESMGIPKIRSPVPANNNNNNNNTSISTSSIPSKSNGNGSSNSNRTRWPQADDDDPFFDNDNCEELVRSPRSTDTDVDSSRNSINRSNSNSNKSSSSGAKRNVAASSSSSSSSSSRRGIKTARKSDREDKEEKEEDSMAPFKNGRNTSGKSNNSGIYGGFQEDVSVITESEAEAESGFMEDSYRPRNITDADFPLLEKHELAALELKEEQPFNVINIRENDPILRNILSAKIPPSFLNKHLVTRMRGYPHQLEGVKWLWTMYVNARGCILADDMGMGKTMQTISLMCAIYRREGTYTDIESNSHFVRFPCHIDSDGTRRTPNPSLDGDERTEAHRPPPTIIVREYVNM